jgi:hypothetical protein
MTDFLNNNYSVPQTVRELEDEIEEEFKRKFEAPSEYVQKEQPMFAKSSCCGQALLLSLKELVPVLEGDHVGLRCDEAYLEDSAIRFLKDSFLGKKCQCEPYKFIFVDQDDPTINIKRFMITVKQVCNDHGATVSVFGCSSSEGRSKNQCLQAGAQFLLKPISASTLKSVLNK